MQINLETDNITADDARALVALFRSKFPTIPDLWNSTADTTVTLRVARPALADEPDLSAEETFGGEVIDEDEDGPLQDARGNVVERPNAELAASLSAEGAGTTSLGDVERDADGIPHDPDIHAGTKGKNADGRWKRKKGVADAVFDARVAELKGLAPPVPGNPASAPTPTPAAPAPAALAPPTPLPPAAIEAAQGAALANPNNFTDGRPPGTDFASIMRRVTAATNGGLLTAEQVQGFVAEVGLTKIADLIKNPNVLPSFAAKIDAQIEMAEAMRAAEAMGG